MAIKQNGSVHAIIIGILTVGLIGALGFIFWQNFSKQQIDSSSQVTKTSQPADGSSRASTVSPPPVAAPKLLSSAIDPAFGTPLKFNYPDTWKLNSEISGPVPLNPSGVTGQMMRLTSPSGEYVVEYNVGANGGLGGMCSPGDQKATLGRVSSQAIEGYPGMSYVEYAVKDRPADAPPMYNDFAGINNSVAAAEYKVGSSIWDTYLQQIIKLKEINYNFELKKFDTDHFFTDKRNELNEVVIRWFNKKLKNIR